MTEKERYQRAMAIVGEVFDLAPDDRDRSVAEQCGADEALEHQVRSLLAADDLLSDDHPLSDGLLDEQRRDVDLLLDDSAAEQHQIGRYRVLREIGRGGMSVVYECEQDNPSRRVAVKLLDKRLAGSGLNRRLRLEAEILGRLRHECIATVYEAGATPPNEGRTPYFAMELVEGVPLTEFADRESLDKRARLELLARVADGIEHAHQRGVIHRDLKPSNILVTPAGVPKILDFGIARVTDADIKTTTMHTSAGAILGTIAYMSPEQASADPAAVDTRSDVYSLGVLGFELLSGRLPHEVDDAPIHEAVRMIREDPPTLLATLDTSLRGDIDTMIAKALEADPDRRYASAAAFADDIRRYLADQPIAARPPSTFYQLRKFSRRNKALVTAVSVIGVALTAATAVSIGFAVNAERSRAEAQAALDDLEVVSDYQAGQLSLIDPQQMGIRLANSLRDERERALTDAGKSPEQIAAELEELRAELAGVNFTEIASAALRENIFEVAAADIESRFADRPMIASGLLGGLADSMIELGLITEAWATQDRAVAIRATHLGETHPDTLALHSGNRLWMAPFAEPEAAERVFRLLSEALPPEDERVLNAQLELSFALALVRDERALELSANAIDAATRGHGPDAEITLVARLRHLGNRGYFDHPAPADENRRLLTDVRRALGDEHELTDRVRGGLYHALYSRGRFDEALPLVESIFEDRNRRFGSTHNLTLKARTEQASVLEELGRLDEAAAELERIIGVADQHYLRSGFDTILNRHNLGFIRFRQGRYDEAEALLAESLVDRREATTYAGRGAATRGLLWHQRNLAMVRVRMGQSDPQRFAGKLDEGESLARETLAATIEVMPGSWVIGHARGVVGVALTARGAYAEAERELTLTYDEVKAGLNPEHEKTRRVAGFLVELYEAWHAAEPDAGHDASADEWRVIAAKPTE